MGTLYVGFWESTEPGLLGRIFKMIVARLSRRERFLDLPIERRLLSNSNAWR